MSEQGDCTDGNGVGWPGQAQAPRCPVGGGSVPWAPEGLKSQERGFSRRMQTACVQGQGWEVWVSVSRMRVGLLDHPAFYLSFQDNH